MCCFRDLMAILLVIFLTTWQRFWTPLTTLNDDHLLPLLDSADATNDDPRLYLLDIDCFLRFDFLSCCNSKMSACVWCHGYLNANVDTWDVQIYRTAELGLDLQSIIDERVERETNEDDLLCSPCFEHIIDLIGSGNQQEPPAAVLQQVPVAPPEQVPAPIIEQGQIDNVQLDEVFLDINRCVWCERTLTRRHTHSLREGLEYNLIAAEISPRQIPENGRVCYACWLTARRRVQQQAEIDEAQVNPNPEIEQYVRLIEYKRTPDTAARCFVRGCINRERLAVPTELRKKLLCEHKLYVTPHSRICREHVSFYDWQFIENYEYIQQFTGTQIEAMLNLKSPDTQLSILNFEDFNSISEPQCHFWVGLAKNEFLNLLEQVPQLRIDAPTNYKTVLALFLIKLRTGEPNVRLGQIFGFSENTVRRLCKKARNCLNDEFVPRHLGINHMTRQNVIERNLHIPEGLFGGNEKAITICDGTYIYLQKSSNYSFQKKSYSLHKFRNLVKPFMMVATDGHIIDVFGPYAATDSDALIIKGIFENNQEVRDFYQEGDIFILDRGFRDALNYLRSLNYQIWKPESLGEGERQLSTIKANRSRCVTLCRWVVEVVNGRFKRDFKIFRNTYFNRAATHLMTNFRIAAAIINAYHPVIEDRPDASMILERALQKLHIPNLLGECIQSERVNRWRAFFVRVDGNLPALNVFPQMSMSELILFSLGTYQIKQARSYYGEHIRENGSFVVEVSHEIEPIILTATIGTQAQQLIRGRIRSRHVSTKMYYTYILINVEGEGWENKIIGYYCNCVVGMRTVGCCAHVCTIVWYLGWARHQEDIEAPASFLDGILVRDDIENEDDDDE